MKALKLCIVFTYSHPYSRLCQNVRASVLSAFMNFKWKNNLNHFPASTCIGANSEGKECIMYWYIRGVRIWRLLTPLAKNVQKSVTSYHNKKQGAVGDGVLNVQHTHTHTPWIIMHTHAHTHVYTIQCKR